VTDRPAVALALANVAREVAAARRAPWLRAAGPAAQAELEAIAAAVDALAPQVGAGLEVEALGALVRRVAAWQPEQGLAIIGALGGLVRAVRAAARA
jgi:hypothetical protein